MRARIVSAFVVLLTAAAALPLFSSGALAATKPTGQTCVAYYSEPGHVFIGQRCATANIIYSSASGNRWHIDYYNIYYTVTGSLSYGPHNNENQSKVSAGFQSGTQAWVSPDSGGANTWISRTGWPGAYSYSGQTVFHIDAWPDIPGSPDPDLSIGTATW